MVDVRRIDQGREEVSVTLDAARDGARRMIAAALEVEVEELVDELDE